jgi:hypothetical protein
MKPRISIPFIAAYVAVILEGMSGACADWPLIRGDPKATGAVAEV